MDRDDLNPTNMALDAEDLFARARWQRSRMRQSMVWHPPTDVYEFEGRILILVEIAGMREREFQVTMQGRHLIINGTRQLAITPGQMDESAQCHQLEINRGHFRTDVYLPWEPDVQAITATYHDGILRVEIPQSPRPQIRIVTLDQD